MSVSLYAVSTASRGIKGFSVSATIEALKFLIPLTLRDELVVVKGDDCPSWRVSLVVKFNIWLNKTKRTNLL